MTRPAPPANPWRSLRLVAESLGTGWILFVVRTEDGQEVRAAVALDVLDGVVRRVTSGSDGSADLVLAVTEAEFRAALGSDDIAGELARRWRSA